MNSVNGNVKNNGSTSRWWPWGRGRGRDRELAEYRRLALQLHYDLAGPDTPRSVLLVTPTVSGACGHSSAALACCLAEELRRPILLIDACPTDPEASRILNCAEDPGFTDMLRDPALSLADLAQTTTRENVLFLAAGTCVDGSPAASVDRAGALLEAARDPYEFVVLSGGPVLSNSVALALAPRVGCVLLLVAENKTKVADLDVAQDALSFCKPRKLGLVLTTPVRG